MGTLGGFPNPPALSFDRKMLADRKSVRLIAKSEEPDD
jgi:hypothetical protein